jgi:translation initiation factor 5A
LLVNYLEGEGMEKIFASAKDLKEGKYILIDDIPCRIVSIEKSKPGKHGAAKMRITAIGIFNGEKKQWLGPSDQDVEIPIIERSNAQIVSVNGNIAQLMDMKTYETFELPIPEEFLSQAEPGKEAELLISMGKKAIQRIK